MVADQFENVTAGREGQRLCEDVADGWYPHVFERYETMIFRLTATQLNNEHINEKRQTRNKH